MARMMSFVCMLRQCSRVGEVAVSVGRGSKRLFNGPTIRAPLYNLRCLLSSIDRNLKGVHSRHQPDCLRLGCLCCSLRFNAKLGVLAGWLVSSLTARAGFDMLQLYAELTR